MQKEFKDVIELAAKVGLKIEPEQIFIDSSGTVGVLFDTLEECNKYKVALKIYKGLKDDQFLEEDDEGLSIEPLQEYETNWCKEALATRH